MAEKIKAMESLIGDNLTSIVELSALSQTLAASSEEISATVSHLMNAGSYNR